MFHNVIFYIVFHHALLHVNIRIPPCSPIYYLISYSTMLYIHANIAFHRVPRYIIQYRIPPCSTTYQYIIAPCSTIKIPKSCSTIIYYQYRIRLWIWHSTTNIELQHHRTALNNIVFRHRIRLILTTNQYRTPLSFVFFHAGRWWRA